MAVVRSFHDLLVWQKAHQLTLLIYQVTASFPDHEKFGLISQIRRASSSIASNIVEGHSRSSRKEFVHFLNIAKGSLEETRYQLLLSKDLGYLNQVKFSEMSKICEELSKMLFSMKVKISSKIS